MLNNETIKFLKGINSITNSIALQYPITVGRTESADIAYMFDLSKLDTDGFDDSLGIYNLSSFLNVFSLFNDSREITLTDNIISVSDENTTANYLLSDLDILSPFAFKKEQFIKNDEFPTVLELKLTSNDLKKIKNASSVFDDLDTVMISCDENTTFSLTKVGEFKLSTNSFRFTKPEKSTKNFKISLSLNTISKIPVVDYTLVVKYNAERNSYRVILNSENLTLVLCTKNV